MLYPARAPGALATRAPPSLLPPLPALPPPFLFLLLSPWEAQGRDGGSARGEERRGGGRGGGAARLARTPGTDWAGEDASLGPQAPRSPTVQGRICARRPVPDRSKAPFPGQALDSPGLPEPDRGSPSRTLRPRAGLAHLLRKWRCGSRRFASNGLFQPPRSPRFLPGVKPTPGPRGLWGGTAAAVGAGPGLPPLRGRSVPGPKWVR